MKNFKKDQIEKKDMQVVKGGGFGYPTNPKDCRRWGGYWDSNARVCILY